MVVAAALALILGFCPIHADDHPYGIFPKEQHVHVASTTDINAWRLRFHSLSECIDTLRQPGFETLTSGETDVAYYVIFRAKPDILIFAYSCKKEEESNSGFELTGPKGSQAMLERNPSTLKIVDLLDTYVETSRSSATSMPPFSGNLTVSKWQAYNLWGFAAKIKPGYAGPLIFKFQLWTEGKDKVRSVASPTINWIAAS